MAGKVFFSVSMSLDGFIAPESPEELMGKLWLELQAWVFPRSATAGSSRPTTHFTAVLLPAPFRPRNPKMRPVGTVSERFSTAVNLPYFFVS